MKKMWKILGTILLLLTMEFVIGGDVAQAQWKNTVGGTVKNFNGSYASDTPWQSSSPKSNNAGNNSAQTNQNKSQKTGTPPASIARPQQNIGAEAMAKVNEKMAQIKEDVAKGHDWQTQSVEGKKEPTKEDKTEENKGSATSGNVAYTGPSSLTGDYGCNTGGNIFQQLACRAGRIGLGLRSVGYIIAGFGLLVFSLSALFGKVKWNVFVTIMFSVFLLSMTFYVINTFTGDKIYGNSKWIAGIQVTDIPSADTINSNVQDTDKSNLPAGEEAPK